MSAAAATDPRSFRSKATPKSDANASARSTYWSMLVLNRLDPALQITLLAELIEAEINITPELAHRLRQQRFPQSARPQPVRPIIPCAITFRARRRDCLLGPAASLVSRRCAEARSRPTTCIQALDFPHPRLRFVHGRLGGAQRGIVDPLQIEHRGDLSQRRFELRLASVLAWRNESRIAFGLRRCARIGGNFAGSEAIYRIARGAPGRQAPVRRRKPCQRQPSAIPAIPITAGNHPPRFALVGRRTAPRRPPVDDPNPKSRWLVAFAVRRAWSRASRRRVLRSLISCSSSEGRSAELRSCSAAASASFASVSACLRLFQIGFTTDAHCRHPRAGFPDGRQCPPRTAKERSNAPRRSASQSGPRFLRVAASLRSHCARSAWHFGKVGNRVVEFSPPPLQGANRRPRGPTRIDARSPPPTSVLARRVSSRASSRSLCVVLSTSSRRVEPPRAIGGKVFQRQQFSQLLLRRNCT